jgi:hypothetical protein
MTKIWREHFGAKIFGAKTFGAKIFGAQKLLARRNFWHKCCQISEEIILVPKYNLTKIWQ